MERPSAVVAGADGDALLIEQLGDVVRVWLGEREADEPGALLRRRAENTQAVDLGKALVGVSNEFVLMASDCVETDAVQIIDGSAQGDGRRSAAEQGVLRRTAAVLRSGPGAELRHAWNF